MTPENVRSKKWIKIHTDSAAPSIDGYVFHVSEDGRELQVGYFQHQMKPVKETVIWKNARWEFANSQPDASYLAGQDAFIVKQGPPKW